jgi:leader peptidase (prepilin peptidase)/N-methyltransferase
VVVTVLLGCLSGSVVGLSLIGLGRLHRRQHIPFGPFLSLGAVIALFWGDWLIARYLAFLY